MSDLITHDRFFRFYMSQPPVARDGLKGWLTPETLQYLDLNRLYLQSTNFIGRHQEHIADVLYKVGIKDSDDEAFIYMLNEQKTDPEELQPLQLLRYQTEIWQDWVRKRHKANQPAHPLPPVICLVFYNGTKSPYPYSMHINDCFGNSPLKDASLNQPYRLIDLSQVDDKTLEGHGLASGFEIVQKHIHLRDHWQFWKDFVHRRLHWIADELGNDSLVITLQYMLKYADIEDVDQFIYTVIESMPERESTIMSMAQQLQDRGRKEGLQQGMQQGMKKMARCLLSDRKRKYTISEIADMTGLSEEEIRRLKDEE